MAMNDDKGRKNKKRQRQSQKPIQPYPQQHKKEEESDLGRK